jgi:hypothetical protein
VRNATSEKSNRHDRALGLACVIACPAISGLFFGLVAAAAVLASGRGNAAAIALLVGSIMFVANACAICLTASTAYQHSLQRARHRARVAVSRTSGFVRADAARVARAGVASPVTLVGVVDRGGLTLRRVARTNGRATDRQRVGPRGAAVVRERAARRVDR